METQLKIKILIGLLVILIVVVAVIVGNLIFKNNNKNTIINTAGLNVNASQALDLQNGFSVMVPEGWTGEYSYVDAINTVKFGSSAQIFTLSPEGSQDEFGGPVVTLQTFTIDKRLSARDVTNLIQDAKTADNIDSDQNKCLSLVQGFSFEGFETYAYKDNSLNQKLCDVARTESAIVETVVVKKTNQEQALIASFTTTNQNDFQRHEGDFEEIFNNIRFSK